MFPVVRYRSTHTICVYTWDIASPNYVLVPSVGFRQRCVLVPAPVLRVRFRCTCGVVVPPAVSLVRGCLIDSIYPLLSFFGLACVLAPLWVFRRFARVNMCCRYYLVFCCFARVSVCFWFLSRVFAALLGLACVLVPLYGVFAVCTCVLDRSINLPSSPFCATLASCRFSGCLFPFSWRRWRSRQSVRASGLSCPRAAEKARRRRWPR